MLKEKNKEVGARFAEIRDFFCNGSNKDFAERVGINEQNASQYCRGKLSIGDKLKERVITAFPKVNRTWLYLGDGEMLRLESDSSCNLTQDGSKINKSIESKNEQQLYDLYNGLIAIIEKKDSQIDRLITILGNKL